MKPTTLSTLATLAVLASQTLAGPLREAKINQIVNDVKIVEPRTGARPATLKESIKDDIGVATGPQSRAELLFQDNTLTRLGAETFFSFEPGTRNVNLERGSMLLQVPKNQGGAHIRAASVSASITGTTITVEHLPGKQVKITVLEGSLNVCVDKRPADRLLLRAGKTVTISPNTKTLPKPTEANLRTVIRTSPLVTPALFNADSGSRAAKLPSMGLIEKEIARQESAPDAVANASAAAPEPSAPKVKVANAPSGHAKKTVTVASSDELATLLSTAAPDASGKVKFSSAATDSAKASPGSRKTATPTAPTAATQFSALSARSNVVKTAGNSGKTIPGRTAAATTLVAVNSTGGGGSTGLGISGSSTSTASTSSSFIGGSSGISGTTSSALASSGSGGTSGRTSGSSYFSAFIAAVTAAINTAIASGSPSHSGSGSVISHSGGSKKK